MLPGLRKPQTIVVSSMSCLQIQEKFYFSAMQARMHGVTLVTDIHVRLSQHKHLKCKYINGISTRLLGHTIAMIVNKLPGKFEKFNIATRSKYKVQFNRKLNTKCDRMRVISICTRFNIMEKVLSSQNKNDRQIIDITIWFQYILQL